MSDLVYNQSDASAVDPYIAFFGHDLLGNYQGEVCVGMRPLEEAEFDVYTSENPPHQASMLRNEENIKFL